LGKDTQPQWKKEKTQERPTSSEGRFAKGARSGKRTLYEVSGDVLD
jgi:hypothetical protein